MSARRAPERPAVVAAAVRLADRDGFEALTVEAVATELDVGTGALHGYFRCEEELRDAVCAELLAQVRDPGPHGDWRVQFRAVLVALRYALCAHPGIAGRYASRPPASPEALYPVEALLAVLRRAGFEGHAVVVALLDAYGRALGLILLEASRRALPGGPDRSVLLGLQLRTLPTVGFAHLRELEPALAQAAERDVFDEGVDEVVEELEARLAALRAVREGVAATSD